MQREFLYALSVELGHPLDRGSLRIHGECSLRPMSSKWWRCPRCFPHLSEGSADFQRAHELFGCSQSFSFPSTSLYFSIWRLLLGNSVATEWMKIQDISHAPAISHLAGVLQGKNTTFVEMRELQTHCIEGRGAPGTR